MGQIKSTPMLMSTDELRELNDRIVEAYGNGLTFKQVGDKLGVSTHTVRNALKIRGIALRYGLGGRKA